MYQLCTSYVPAKGLNEYSIGKFSNCYRKWKFFTILKPVFSAGEIRNFVLAIVLQMINLNYRWKNVVKVRHEIEQYLFFEISMKIYFAPKQGEKPYLKFL